MEGTPKVRIESGCTTSLVKEVNRCLVGKLLLGRFVNSKVVRNMFRVARGANYTPKRVSSNSQFGMNLVSTQIFKLNYF